MRITIDSLESPNVIALLQEHLEEVRSVSPPESTHALDFAGLRRPDVTFWSAWLGRELVGCCALKELTATHGEIKSMRTARDFKRRGVGAAMLKHALAEAGRRGYDRVSLETGSQAHFSPARALYTSFGFQPCEPFAQYIDDPNSVFMTKVLELGAGVGT